MVQHYHLKYLIQTLHNITTVGIVFKLLVNQQIKLYLNRHSIMNQPTPFMQIKDIRASFQSRLQSKGCI